MSTKHDTNIADVLPEPPDGTHLVRVEYDNTHTVIWRDDSDRTSNYPDERWLNDQDCDAMGWREILRYATAVHGISAEPLATLPPAKVTV
jgi:hypothetical protein